MKTVLGLGWVEQRNVRGGTARMSVCSTRGHGGELIPVTHVLVRRVVQSLWLKDMARKKAREVVTLLRGRGERGAGLCWVRVEQEEGVLHCCKGAQSEWRTYAVLAEKIKGRIFNTSPRKSAPLYHRGTSLEGSWEESNEGGKRRRQNVTGRYTKYSVPRHASEPVYLHSGAPPSPTRSCC